MRLCALGIALATLVAIATLAPMALASRGDVYGVLESIGKRLLEIVGYSRVSSDVLAITDFSYVVIDGYSMCPLTVALIEAGFLPLRNLVVVHESASSAPWLFIYDEPRSEAIFIELSRSAVAKAIEMYASGRWGFNQSVSYVLSHGIEKLAKFRFNPLDLVRKGVESPRSTWIEFVSNTSREAAFSVATISLAWVERAPQDLMLAAEFHNHVCPGLLSGYLIYRYLESEGLIPRKAKVYVIAEPPWCKDDAYAILLDATPGKRRMAVKLVPKPEIESLAKELGLDPAGAIVVYNESSSSGKLILVGFNFTKVRQLAEIPSKVGKSRWGWWVKKMLEDEAMLKLIDRPSEVVKVIKVIEFRGRVGRYPKLFYELARVGTDMYRELGLLKPLSASSTSTPSASAKARYVYAPYFYATWILLAICVALAIALAMKARR